MDDNSNGDSILARPAAPIRSDKAAYSAANDDSIAELARLTARQGQLDLESALFHVATLATHAIPGADGVGLTLLEDGVRADTMVASIDFVRDVDAIQYGIGQGPCITAAATGHTVHSADLSTDVQWPEFGPKVVALGVHSVLSLPLIHPRGNILGAMNVYAHAENAFTDHAIVLGETFAVPAAISVQNAHVLARARRASEEMHQVLADRTAVDVAIGVLTSKERHSPDGARRALRAVSVKRGVSLVDAAKLVIADALVRDAQLNLEE